MALLAKVRLEALIDKRYISENEKFSLTALFWNPSEVPISSASFTLLFPSSSKICEQSPHLNLSSAMKHNHPALLNRWDYTIESGSDTFYSVPGWLAEEPIGDSFQVPDENLPLNQGIYPPLKVLCQYSIMDYTFEITGPVVYLDCNRKHARRIPVQIVP